MKDASNFIGWDFDNIWAIDPDKNDGYPYLQWQTSFTEKDTVAPVITLNGSSNVTIYVDDIYNDVGASALDNADGDISASIVVSSTVNESVVGTYQVSYNVSDQAGNPAVEVVRVVKVVEKTNTTNSSSSSGGSGGGILYKRIPTETTFQSYDPKTGVLIESEEKEEKEQEEAEEVVVLGVEFDINQVDNLYGQGKDIVEAVSLSEAEIVFGYNEEIEMDEEIAKIYQSIIATEELTSEELMSIAYFIQVGTKTTARLGAGERAGVVNSFRSAFGHLPEALADWQDVIKIANGRWPGITSTIAEEAAKDKFVEIYMREANLNDANDNAAVSIIAYGLRPVNRNLASEQAAVKIFKSIFGNNPESATDWDVVRAIAYSGAKR